MEIDFQLILTKRFIASLEIDLLNYQHNITFLLQI